jgi:hypothetical protein
MPQQAHPIDAQLDQLLAPEGVPTAKAGQQAVSAPHPIDQQIDQALTPVQEPSELEQSLNLKYDPSKDWDTARQALDSATFGAITKDDPKLIKAKAAWEKVNGPAAVAADFAGSTAPSVVLSTLAGQGIFRAGQLASKLAGNPLFEDAARFLTGQLGGSRLTRLASQATWGAGQGLTTGLYGKYMGQDEDLGGEALLGATTGPLSNVLFAPYRSNISPEVSELAKNWSRQGLGLSAAQLPGAPPMLRAVSKLLSLGKSDMNDVTASLMRSTGSTDTALTPANLDKARAAIRSGLVNNVHSAWASIPNEKMPKAFEDTLNSGVLTPQQAQSIRLAQNQWTNAGILDRVAANSVSTPGVAAPKALVNAMRTAQYPGGMSASTAAAGSGNPVDMDTLARGSQLFVPPGNQHGSGLSAALGLAGGGLAAEGFEHAMPYLEQVMPHLPLLAHAATVYGGINAAAAPLALPFMASPAYRYLLTHGGVGPVANPLLPSVVQNPDYQSKVDWMKNYLAPTTPAHGATLAPDALQPQIAGAATKYGLDANLLTRQLQKESNFQNLGPNKSGATGIAQFTPDTAKQYGIDPTDPVQSVEGQAHYMHDLTNQFGNSGLALAAYNWGPGNMRKWLASGADPKKLPDETTDYVQSVSGLPIENWLPNAKRITIPLGDKLQAANAGALVSNELTGSPQ